MKNNIAVLLILLATTGAWARIIGSFATWKQLQGYSPDIIVAHCGNPALMTGTVVNGTAFDSNIRVLLVLKGENGTNSVRLLTDHKLEPGNNYLAFGYYKDGLFEAYEACRVIPLGVNFSTDTIAGKPLEDQLQILFKRGVDVLNQEIQSDMAEKEWVQKAIVQ